MNKQKNEEEKYDNNSEYVIFDPEPTVILFGTPKMYLTILSSGETLLFEKNIVTVGRYKDRDLFLEGKKYVARYHATFIYEKNMWFLKDENSTNGTYLNGIRIKKGKKYQLRENDIIDFAMSEKVVFTTYIKSEKGKHNVSYINDGSIDSYINSVIADKYHIRGKYGENDFHSIYLATDMTDNKTWVMKIGRKINIGNDIFNRDAILKEAYILKNFQHPMIPLMGELIENETGIYLIREYIEGETLEYIIKKWGAQSVEKVVKWAKELCDLLIYLHGHTPAHIYMDMKPSNVILMPNNHIKVIDFGSVMVCDQKQKDNMCNIGTIGYAAPEQYNNCAQTDERTDIYGLGMTMYYLVTGVEPVMLMNPDYDDFPSLPKGLDCIINKCIESDPAKRYQSADELMNDLNNYENLSVE